MFSYEGLACYNVLFWRGVKTTKNIRNQIMLLINVLCLCKLLRFSMYSKSPPTIIYLQWWTVILHRESKFNVTSNGTIAPWCDL